MCHMTLFELGKQYIEESKRVLSTKQRLQERLKGADFYQSAELKDRIAILSEMADECRRTGELLCAYYNFS